MTTNGHSDSSDLSFDDEWDVSLPTGEYVAFPEALVVSPGRGRLRRSALHDGTAVSSGHVLGEVQRSDGRDPFQISSPIDGIFLGWLAWDGEHVTPGALLARIARNGTDPGNGSPDVERKNGSR